MTKKKLIILASVAGILVLTIIIILIAGSCGRKQTVKADSAENLALLAKNAISANDYGAFQSLFTQGTREKVSQQSFGTFYQSITDDALYSNYVLMRLENGQMLLLYISGPDSQGLYHLQDVRAVSSESYDLFNH
ncbi:MAG: hypothetical protein VB070_03415 [Clostridiaceae bacterium]|nr:hypothetical protein [Clostridiaceae bacterium]